MQTMILLKNSVTTKAMNFNKLFHTNISRTSQETISENEDKESTSFQKAND